jgi:hypothetical protein
VGEGDMVRRDRRTREKRNSTEFNKNFLSGYKGYETYFQVAVVQKRRQKCKTKS